MKKKLLSMFLVLAMLVSITPLPVHAAESTEPVIYIDTADVPETLKAGDTFDVGVAIKNNPGICMAYLELVIPDVFTYVELTNNSNAKTCNYNVGTLDGKTVTSVSWEYATDFDADYTEDGRLYTLTFAVNEDAEGGDYDILIGLLSGNSGNLGDVEGDVAATFEKGTITIAGDEPEQPPVITEATYKNGSETFAYEDLSDDVYDLTAPGNDYYFGGWFSGLTEGNGISVENGYYVLSASGTSNAQNFTGVVESRPKYEDEPAAAIYNALWVKDDFANATATMMLAVMDNNSLTYYVTSDADDTQMPEKNARLMYTTLTAVNGAGRVKLVNDFYMSDMYNSSDLESNLNYMDCEVRLDMNGCEITSTEFINDRIVEVSEIVYFRKGTNNALESSRGRGSLVAGVTNATTSAISVVLCGADRNVTVQTIRDVDITSKNKLKDAENDVWTSANGIEVSNATVLEIANCTISNEKNSALKVNTGCVVETITGTTMTTTGGAVVLNNGTVIFGADNTINVAGAENVVDGGNNGGKVGFTSTDSTYQISPAGDPLSATIKIIDTPAGKIVAETNGAITFADGFLLKYMSYDGQTLLHAEQVAKGGTPAGYTVTYAQEGDVAYNHIGWATEQGGTAVALNTLTAHTTLYALREEVEVAAGNEISASVNGAAAVEYETIDEFVSSNLGKTAALGSPISAKIKLLKDATLSQKLYVEGHTVEIDLNGHTLTMANTTKNGAITTQGLMADLTTWEPVPGSLSIISSASAAGQIILLSGVQGFIYQGSSSMIGNLDVTLKNVSIDASGSTKNALNMSKASGGTLIMDENVRIKFPAAESKFIPSTLTYNPPAGKDFLCNEDGWHTFMDQMQASEGATITTNGADPVVETPETSVSFTNPEELKYRESLTVKSVNASLKFLSEALDHIAELVTGNVTLSATDTTKAGEVKRVSLNLKKDNGEDVAFNGAVDVEFSFEGRENGNFNVYHLNGSRKEDMGATMTYANGKWTAKFTTTHFSEFLVEDNVTYTLTPVFDKDTYLPGETATVTFNLTSDLDAYLGAFMIDLPDSIANLTFNSIAPAAGLGSIPNSVNGNKLTANVVMGNSNGVLVTSGTPVAIATATFTVSGTVADGAELAMSIADAEITSESDLYPAAAVTLGTDTAAAYHRFAFTTSAENVTIGNRTGTVMEESTEKAVYQTAISFAVTPAAGYVVDTVSYKVGSSEAVVLTAENGTYTIPAEAVTDDITVTATGKRTYWPITFVTENASIQTKTGTYTIDGVEYAKIGEAVEITVAPAEGYVIGSVSYTVNGTTNTVTAVDGKYTIPASDANTGAITVNVTGQKYYVVTFAAGEGTTINGATTAYAYAGAAILYATKNDAGLSGEFVVPTMSANDHYCDPLWYVGDQQVETNAIGSSYLVNEATTFTAKATPMYYITFNAGEHGTLTNGDQQEIKAGTALSALTLPTINAEPGYKANGWKITKTNGGAEFTGSTVTEALTYTAQYADETYELTLPSVANVTWEVTGETVVKISDTKYEITHNTEDKDVTIKMVIGNDVKVTEVVGKVNVENGATKTVADANGVSEFVWTIAGEDVKGAIDVTLTSNVTYTITVVADGEFANQITISPASKTYDQDTAIAADDFTIRFVPGYVVDTNELAAVIGTAVNANTTYKVTAKHGSYEVKMGETVLGTATHGTDFTWTPAVTDKIVVGVAATVTEGETVKSITVTENADGSYTIAGADLTGEIAVTYTYLNGGASASLDEISYLDYAGLEAGSQTKIALLDVEKLSEGTYKLEGYGDMFWSSKYNAYVCIVGESETAASLSAKVSVDVNATLVEISYSGDINSTSEVTAADSAPISAALHQLDVNYVMDNKMRLELDVNGDKTVDVEDIMYVLNIASGKGNG